MQPSSSALPTDCRTLQEQSLALNGTLNKRGRHTHEALIFGSGWTQPEELHRAVSGLTHPELGAQRPIMCLDVNTLELALALGSALRSLSPERMAYAGAAVGVFPPSLLSSKAIDTFVSHCGSESAGLDLVADAIDDQAHSQQLLRSLQPLSLLRDLTLHQQLLQLTATDVRNLAAWCPRLERLTLFLCSFQELQHDLHSLSTLWSVQVGLHIRKWESRADVLTALLSQIPGLALHTLSLEADYITDLDAEYLACCTVQQQLTLSVEDPFWRLRREPPGVKVVYTSG